MLRRITELVDRHARGRTLLAAVAASVIFGVAPLTWVVHRMRASAPDAAPLDMAGAYTPDEAYAMIARYGDDVRSVYVWNAFTFDIVAPLLFNATVALAALMLLRRVMGQGSRLRVVPVGLALVGFSADVVENVLLAILVTRFPGRADGVAQAACVATVVKRGAIFTSWGVLAGLAVAAGVQAVRGRRRGDPGGSRAGTG